MNIVFLAHNCNVSFIENELNAILLDNRIESLIIFTDQPYLMNNRTLNDKIKVIEYRLPIKRISILQVMFLLIAELFYNRVKYNSFKRLRQAISNARNEIKKAQFIFESKIPRDAIFYSFWASNEAFTLSWLKYQGLKNLAITRMHAYDIYENYDNNGSIPWRWFHIKYMDLFLPISEHGKKYFLKKYPEMKGKVDMHYLGIEMDKFRKLNACPDKVIRIVSCAWINAHKNISGIFRALNEMENVEWFHIGGGDGFEELQQEVLRDGKIVVNLMGGKSQKEIQEIYTTLEFTCFISLSTTEGLPVSMMEAMSFGIPIISTDVGGCGEIVNENTGVLLKSDYTMDDVRAAVLSCQLGPLSLEVNRLKAQQECSKKFNAKENYKKFFGFIERENLKHLESIS